MFSLLQSFLNGIVGDGSRAVGVSIMALKFLGKTADLIWAALALVLVLLAIYVGIGRQLITHIGDYRQDLEQLIIDKTGYGVSIGDIDGEWPLFTPVIQLTDVSFFPQNEPEKAFFFSSNVTINIGIVASLIAQQPRLKDLQIHGLNVAIEELESGQWRVNGIVLKNNPKKDTSADAGSGSIVSLLLNQELITLSDSSLTLDVLGKPTRSISRINAQLKNISGAHEFSGSILMGEQGQRLIFAAKGEGDPRDQDDYELELYAKLDQGTVWSWLPDDVKQKYSSVFGVSLQELSIAGEVWASWREGGLHDINGLFEADSIQLQDARGFEVSPIENMVGQFEIEFGEEGELGIAIDHFQFDWQNEFWRESQLKVRLVKEGDMRPPSVEVFANHVQVSQVLQLASLSDRVDHKLRELLEGTQINGELNDLNLRYYPRQKSFLVRSQFGDISSVAWKNFPGVSGLSGYVEMTPNGGALNIDSEGAAVDYPRYFRKPVYTRRLSGPAVWVLHKSDSGIDEVEVKSGFLQLQNPDVKGEVAFSLRLPFDGYAPKLNIFANINQAKVHKVSQYLPKVLPSSLLHWLDESLVRGEGKATLVFNGPLRLKGLRESDFTLQTDIFAEHLYLDYLPNEWPPVEDARGKLLVNGADVFFEMDQGRIYGAPLKFANGTILENQQGFKDLKIQGELDADSSEVIRFLNETPISEMMGALTKEWKAEGSVNAAVQLTVPINGPSRPVEVHLNAALKDTRINVTDLDLVVENMNGNLVYDTHFGLFGEGLDCTVMGYPAKANFLKLDQTQSRLFELELDSTLDMKRLNQWADQPLLQFMDGEFDYRLNIWVQRNDRVGDSETDAWLSVSSDLLGVDVAIPEPLKKSAKQSRATQFKMSLGDFPSQIFVQYGDQFSSALLVDSDDLIRAQLSFSEKPAVMPSTNGMFAGGEIEFMDWGLWETFFTDIGNVYESTEAQNLIDEAGNALDVDEELFVDKVNSVDLKLARFVGYGLEIDTLDAHVWREDGSWMIYGNSPMVKGRLKVPDDSRPLDINLSHLILPEEEIEEGAEISAEESIIEESPMQFPNVILQIDHYLYGDMDLGSWSLLAHRGDESYIIEDLRIKLGQLVLTAEGEWKQDGEQTVTQFQGSINTQDIGELMKIWDYPVVIETSSAGISFKGSWPHSPFDFYLNRIDGDLGLRFKDGRFLDVDATVSALRVLGVLNFSNLGRRLKFDFKDLYQGGLSFDRLKGPVNVSKGLISFDGMEIKGPSASFDVNGTVDFVDDALALEIALTLPLSKNLAPVAGVVAGPLGVVLGVVIDRVIGDQINQMFRTHYEVTGTSSNPDFRIVTRESGSD